MHHIQVALLVVWVLLMVPWFFIAPLLGMAFDGGSTLEAYILVSSVWSYPLCVLIAFLLARRLPKTVFLPFLNLAVFVVSDLIFK